MTSSLPARLLAHDVRVSAALQRLGERSSWVRTAAIPLARSADGWPWMVGTLAVALLGDATVRPRALSVAALVLATGIAVKIAKLLTRRTRPEGEWGGSYRRSDPHAFPSGHSARAFLLSVLAFALGPVWLGLAMTAWAALVATSRVTLGVHYVSDVLGGALLGLAFGIAAAGL